MAKKKSTCQTIFVRNHLDRAIPPLRMQTTGRTVRDHLRAFSCQYREVLDFPVVVYLGQTQLSVEDWDTTYAPSGSLLRVLPATGEAITWSTIVAFVADNLGWILLGSAIVSGGLIAYTMAQTKKAIEDMKEQAALGANYRRTSQTSTYSWNGATTQAKEGLPIPVVYGRNMLGGNVISESITSDPASGDSQLTVLLALAEGPLLSIDESGIIIEETRRSDLQAADLTLTTKAKLGVYGDGAESDWGQAVSFNVNDKLDYPDDKKNYNAFDIMGAIEAGNYAMKALQYWGGLNAVQAEWIGFFDHCLPCINTAYWTDPADPYWVSYYSSTNDVMRLSFGCKYTGQNTFVAYRYRLVSADDHNVAYTPWGWDTDLFLTSYFGITYGSYPHGTTPASTSQVRGPGTMGLVFSSNPIPGVIALPSRNTTGMIAREVNKSMFKDAVTQAQYDNSHIQVQWRRMDAYTGSFLVESCTEHAGGGVAYDGVALLNAFFPSASSSFNGTTPNIQTPVRGLNTVRTYFDEHTYVESYSTNPVWCLLDLLTNVRYGLGRLISWDMIDIATAIQSAQYCDTYVDSTVAEGTLIDLLPSAYSCSGGVTKTEASVGSSQEETFSLSLTDAAPNDRLIVKLPGKLTPTTLYCGLPILYMIADRPVAGTAGTAPYYINPEALLFALEYSDDGTTWTDSGLRTGGIDLSFTLPADTTIGPHEYWAIRCLSSRKVYTAPGGTYNIAKIPPFGRVYVNAKAEKLAEFNGVLDTEMDATEAIGAILNVCGGRVAPSPTGQLQILVDRPTPVSQIFTKASILDQEITYSYASQQEIVNALEVKFQDSADDFKETTILVSTGDVPFRSTSANYRGVITQSQALRLAKTQLNRLALCSSGVTFKIPIEALAVNVGAVIGLQDRVINTANGGRVTALSSAGSVRTLTLAEPVCFETGITYELHLTYVDGEGRRLLQTMCAPAGTLDPSGFTNTNKITLTATEFLADTDFSLESPMEYIICQANMLSKYRIEHIELDTASGTLTISATTYDERVYSMTGLVHQAELHTITNKVVTTADALNTNPVQNVVLSTGADGASFYLSFDRPIKTTDYLDTRVSVTRLGEVAWTLVGTMASASRYQVTGLLQGETYTVRLEPRTLGGVVDTTSTSLLTIQLASSSQYPPTVQKLQVAKTTGNDLNYIGNDCEITWSRTTPQGEEAPAASFMVKVYAGTVFLRQEAVKGTGYNYTYQLNLADNKGEPVRDLTFEVWSISANGVYSVAGARATFSNPLPKEILGAEGQGSFGAALIRWVKSSGEPDLLGYNVYAKLDSAGVTSEDYVGTTKDTSYMIKAIKGVALGSGGKLYVRVVGVDGFGPGDVTAATEISFEMGTIDLPTYSMDVPFTDGLAWSVVNGYAVWTAGKLSYKGKDYTLASGSTADPYIFWDLAKPNELQHSATLPTLTTDRWMMMYFDGVTAQAAEAKKIIHGGLIQADTITADQILVNELSAIAASVGALEVKTGGHLRGGQTGYDNGPSGFWLGYDFDAYKFSLGNPTGNKLLWDGDNLVIHGTIYATDSNLNYNPPVSKSCKFLVHFDYSLKDNLGLAPSEPCGGKLTDAGWSDKALQCNTKYGHNLLPYPSCNLMYSEEAYVIDPTATPEEAALDPWFSPKVYSPLTQYWKLTACSPDLALAPIYCSSFLMGHNPRTSLEGEELFLDVHLGGSGAYFTKAVEITDENELTLIAASYAPHANYVRIEPTLASLVRIDKEHAYSLTCTFFLHNVGYYDYRYYYGDYRHKPPCTNAGLSKNWHGAAQRVPANASVLGTPSFRIYGRGYDLNKNPVTPWFLLEELLDVQQAQQMYCIGADVPAYSQTGANKITADTVYLGVAVELLEGGSPLAAAQLHELSIRQVLAADEPVPDPWSGKLLLPYAPSPQAVAFYNADLSQWGATAFPAAYTNAQSPDIAPNLSYGTPYSNTAIFPQGGPLGDWCLLVPAEYVAGGYISGTIVNSAVWGSDAGGLCVTHRGQLSYFTLFTILDIQEINVEAGQPFQLTFDLYADDATVAYFNADHMEASLTVEFYSKTKSDALADTGGFNALRLGSVSLELASPSSLTKTSEGYLRGTLQIDAVPAGTRSLMFTAVAFFQGLPDESAVHFGHLATNGYFWEHNGPKTRPAYNLLPNSDFKLYKQVDKQPWLQKYAGTGAVYRPHPKLGGIHNALEDVRVLSDTAPLNQSTWSEIIEGAAYNILRMHYRTSKSYDQSYPQQTYSGNWFGLYVLFPGFRKLPLFPGKYWRLSFKVRVTGNIPPRVKDRPGIKLVAQFGPDQLNTSYISPWENPDLMPNLTGEHYFASAGEYEFTFIISNQLLWTTHPEYGGSVSIEEFIPSLAERWLYPVREYPADVSQNLGLIRDTYVTRLSLHLGQDPHIYGEALDGPHATVPYAVDFDIYQLQLECCDFPAVIPKGDAPESELTAFAQGIITPRPWAPPLGWFPTATSTPTVYRGVPVGPYNTICFRMALPSADWPANGGTQCIFASAGHVLPFLFYNTETKQLIVMMHLSTNTYESIYRDNDCVRTMPVIYYDVANWLPGVFHTIALKWDDKAGTVTLFVDNDITSFTLDNRSVYRRFATELWKNTDPVDAVYTPQPISFYFGTDCRCEHPFGGKIDEIRYDAALISDEILTAWYYAAAPFGDINEFVNRGGTVTINDSGIIIDSRALTLEPSPTHLLSYKASGDDAGDFLLGEKTADAVFYDQSENLLSIAGDVKVAQVVNYLDRPAGAIPAEHARIYVDANGNLLVETADKQRRMITCGAYILSPADVTTVPSLPTARFGLHLYAESLSTVPTISRPLVGTILFPQNVETLVGLGPYRATPASLETAPTLAGTTVQHIIEAAVSDGVKLTDTSTRS